MKHTDEKMTRRFLTSKLPRPGKDETLDAAEAWHAIRVLRLRSGDIAEILDGEGGAIRAELKIQGKQVILKYLKDSAPVGITETLPCTLEIAVLKNDAMTWVIEKAVELGAQTLQPLFTRHCVPQARQSRLQEALVERWKAIADQALKQCGRRKRLVVLPGISFEQWLNRSDRKINGVYCDEALNFQSEGLFSKQLLELTPIPQPFPITIGPEGGWSSEERALLAQIRKPVTLGPLTLRAETAAIQALSIFAEVHRLKMLTKKVKFA